MIKIFPNSYLHSGMCIPVHLRESDGKLDMKQEMTLLLHMKGCKKVFLADDLSYHVCHCLVLV